MNKIIIFLSLFLIAFSSEAQTCKIKISYDGNGNRIQRIEDCTGLKPGTPADSTIADKNKTGIKENKLAGGDVMVYPNPSENSINVKITGMQSSSLCSIVMTDITGKTLYVKDNVSDEVSVINLKPYADGAYLVSVIVNSQRKTIKIVKQTGIGY